MSTHHTRQNITFNLDKQCVIHYFYVSIYFSNDESKKQLHRHEMTHCFIDIQCITYDLLPFIKSLSLPDLSMSVLDVSRGAVLLNVPAGYFSFAFNYEGKPATQLFPQQAATDTHFCLLQLDIDRCPSPLSLNLH